MKKVLVWGLTNNRAGTEAVIVNYASRAQDTSFDFLCYEAPLNHWEKLDRNGNRYFVIPSKIKNPIAYRAAFSQFMNEHNGEYDALWFNVNDAANVDPLKYALKHGIGRRIVHMHNSQVANSLLTRSFHALNKRKLVGLSTECWACSDAAASFLGSTGNVRIVANAIDVDTVSFSPEKRSIVRAKLGLDDAFVVGSVGRLTPQKDPGFLVEILPALVEERENAHLLFVGTGELEGMLREKSEMLGVAERVHLVGSQEDMQAYLSACDAYAQPSRYEGFGISVLEAQFNGLPCTVSDAVPHEVDITNAIEHIPTAEVDAWVKALCSRDRTGVSLLDRARRYDAHVLGDSIDELFS